MNVNAIMTTRLVTVSEDDSLAKVRNIFATEHFHHLLVVEHDHTLVGVISDRDLLKAINADKDFAGRRQGAAGTKKAHQIMSRHPVVLRSGASLNDAIDLLVEHDLSCLPVINQWGAAIGVVSWKDLLRYLHRAHIPGLRPCPA